MQVRMQHETTEPQEVLYGPPAPLVGGGPGPEPLSSVGRLVWRIAWPAILENLLQTALGIVDLLMVSRLGAPAVAGVGTAVQLTFLLISVMSAITVGAMVLIAHATGARRPERATEVARQALLLGLLLSVAATAIGVPLSEPAVRLLGVTGEVARIGGDYLRIVMAFSLVLIWQLTAGALLRGAGDSRTPLAAALAGNVLNAVLAYGLIFGHFGLPQLGAAGSAWAATAGRLLGLLILARVLLSRRGAVTLRGSLSWRVEPGLAIEVLRLGLPAMLEQVLISLAFTTFTAIVATLGTQALAAQRIAFNALSLSFLPGFGFAIATTTVVGMSLGGGRPDRARRAVGFALRAAMLWMGTIGVCYFFLGVQVLRLFSDDPLVIAQGAASLKSIALAQPAWAIGMVLSGALRGAGDTRFPMLANAGSFWLGLVPLSFIFIRLLGLDLPWGFAAAIAQAVLGVTLNVWRYRHSASRWQGLATVAEADGQLAVASAPGAAGTA